TATADNLVAVAGAGTSLSNYSITTTNGSIQVSPLAITGTAQVNGKVYDGTTVGTGTITLTGLLPADVGSTSASGTFTFANSNAGTKAATVSGVTVNNADYSITVPASAGNATITTAALTITGGTTTTSFDNTTHTNTYSITSGALFGSDVISSVNGLGSGLHANTYTDSGLSASGTGLSNYAISYVPGSLTINPATFTAAITPNVATYTGTNVIANTTVLTGAMNGVTITATTSLTTSGINAGIQTIINNGTTLSGANAGDYVITSSTILNNGGIGAANNQVIPGSGPNNSGSTIVIVPKTLTITGNTTTPTYNGSTQTNTYVVTGLVNGETITASGAAQATHVSPTATADNLVAVAGAGTSLSNYSITTTNGSIQVTPLAITGTAQVNGKVYNGTTVGTGTIILTGVLPADVASTTATGTYTFANANAGAAKAATVSGVTINNTDYSVTVAPSAGTATITAAALTISGNTTTGTFDNTTHTNTYSITSGSLFGSDVINSVSGLGGGLHANTYSDSGLSANGTGLSNYTISYVPGSLTINPATLTAAVTPSVATYNGSNVLANATVLSGVISGTTVSGTTSLTVSATNAGTQTITNNGTTLSGANAGDYVIASTSIANNGGVGAANNQVIPGTGPNNTGSTIVIVPKTLTITGNTTTPTYNGSAQTNTYVVTGLVNGETITATGAAQATHVSPTATADNLVAVAGAGTSLSNYSITTTNGSIQVTPLAITGTAQVNGKVYD
ncbi:beta strand repeat-containing protein, partial [Polynucleobacter kasalickyi]